MKFWLRHFFLQLLGRTKDRHGPWWCRACWGGECRGGGVPRCWQRDRMLSILAGVLDTYGGLRFVVTYPDHLRYHVRHDEVAIGVPGVVVREPIAWNDIPSVVGRIELEVDRWIEQRGIPNEPHAREAVTMYNLRKLEDPRSKRSLDLQSICET